MQRQLPTQLQPFSVPFAVPRTGHCRTGGFGVRSPGQRHGIGRRIATAIRRRARAQSPADGNFRVRRRHLLQPAFLSPGVVMPSELYWIDADATARLAIMARPRAGDWLEEEIAHWKNSGVGIVVSLLEPEEIDDLGLGMEASLCEASGIEYVSFPIPDRGLPSDTQDALRFAADVMARQKPIAIHCRAGIGRSSIMAAALLVGSGVRPEIALAAIAEARRLPIPDTEAQREWVLNLEQCRN